VSRASRKAERARKREARRTRLTRAENLRARPAWATIVQALAFVRKELAEILRQPRLLLLLVVGPFLILLLFGAGYRDTNLDLRTQFVGPEGSIYEDAVTDYADVLADYIIIEGFDEDEAQAIRRLDEGEIDVVVVFPTDPLADIVEGDSADIEIIHRELDPFQQAAIEIAARLAVQEVNASVLGAIAGSAQEALAPVDELAAQLLDRAGTLAQASASDPEATQTAAAEASETLVAVRLGIAASRDVLDRLGGTEQAEAAAEMLDRLDAAATEADALGAEDGAATSERASELGAVLEGIATDLPRLTTVDPQVLVRPFESDTQSRVTVEVNPTDFYAPSSIMLLLQHLALTFAALSLVRDREIGLLELLRVGPLSSVEILTGKTIAYLLVGSAVGGLLIAAAVFGLDVPFEGDVDWAAAAVVLVLLASLALGMVLSLISGSETQAVQFAMLSLLAGMFFSGFILDVDGLAEPYRYLSYLLPVTYGIRIMHDVMLRGVAPDSADLLGLGALVVGYGLLAVLMLRRRLRTE
jgi:ABC-2 type transport system permease protein